MHERVHYHNEAANHQLPIAAGFWIIWIVSVEECSSLMQNLMQIHCSTCSGILNVTATQNTCSLNGVYCPHWPVQWSCHSSHMCIPVHSPWLPGGTDDVQTIFIILTMAGLFLDRPCILATGPLRRWLGLNEVIRMRSWSYRTGTLRRARYQAPELCVCPVNCL